MFTINLWKETTEAIQQISINDYPTIPYIIICLIYMVVVLLFSFVTFILDVITFPIQIFILIRGSVE